MNNRTDTHSDNTHRKEERPDASKSPKQLEREVDQARSRLERTANELSERLSPEELFDQAVSLAKEHGGEFSRNLGAQVKNNPMPMILSSVGISWMMYSSGKQGPSQGARNAHSDQAAAVGGRMQDAGADAKESVQNAGQSLVRFYREQPLIAGSLGIAIGAALGALVPPTEMEDDVMGETSDHSVDAAKSTAVKEYDEVRDSMRPN